MDLIIGILLGLLAWFIANLFLPATIALIIGILVAIIYIANHGAGWRA